MLCKAESRDPEHCLKEGRKVTRCAQDLYVSLSSSYLCTEQTDKLCATQYLQGPIDVLEGV